MGTEAADGTAEAGGLLGLGDTVRELRAAYEGGRTRSVAWRQAQLRGLLRLLQEKEAEAFQALRTDLGKHHAEAYRDEVTSLAGIQPSLLHVLLLFLSAFVRAFALFE
jgi:aldehyde dehydrogenase (NAD+)